MTNLDSNRRSDRLNGICFILGYEQPIHIELHQAISEDGDRMMPRPVVVGERTHDFREHVRADRLVEGRAEPAIGHDAQFPRTAASLDSTVVRRRIRCPVEPCGNSEIRAEYGNRGGGDPISADKRPRPAHFSGDVCCAYDGAVVALPREVYHLP